MWTGKATPINISFRNLGLLCWIKFRLSKDDLGLTWFLPVPLPMGQFALYCYDYHILYSLSVFGSSALQFQDHTSVILWQVQQRLVKNRWFSLRSVPAPHEHVQPFPSLVANICIEMHICLELLHEAFPSLIWADRLVCWHYQNHSPGQTLVCARQIDGIPRWPPWGDDRSTWA